MSGISPEQAATVTPGQAAYEAHPVSQAVDAPWETLDAEDRDGWEAAAQAAIDAYGVLAAVYAGSGETIVIAFNRPLDQRTAHEIRERWAAGAPGVTIAIVDNVAAIEASKPGSERVAELVTEVNELRETLSSPAELARWVEINHGDHPEWVNELRALLPVDDTAAAVADVGTGHLAEKIRGLAIPDEES